MGLTPSLEDKMGTVSEPSQPEQNEILETQTYTVEFDDRGRGDAFVSILNPNCDLPLPNEMRARGYETFGVIGFQWPGKDLITVVWMVDPNGIQLHKHLNGVAPDPLLKKVAFKVVQAYLDTLANRLKAVAEGGGPFRLQ